MESKPKVKSAAKMDDTTFLKHINARHVPIAGLSVVGPSNAPGDEDEGILRAYHDKIHSLPGRDPNHTHEDA
ncbi:MAG: hypothetical protein ACM3UO_00405 [Bacillota bacterium]